MSNQYDELITRFPLFAGYTPHGARMMREQGEIKTYQPGEVVFREGDAATVVLLLLSGKLEVYVDRQGQNLALTEAGPGTILGELAVLCGIPRSATVRAVEQSVVLQWESVQFRRMLLGDAGLSERIFRHSLRTLIDKERSMIDSLMKQSRSSGART